MLRIIKILLIAAVAGWAVVGLWDNFAAWDGTTRAVSLVTSMKTLPLANADLWRATMSPTIIYAGVAFIVMFKLITGCLCAVGAWQMARSRAADAESFARAKSLAVAGCAIAVFGLFAGWIVIAEEWYDMYQSARDAGELAFRFGGFIGLIALIVAAREE